MVEVGVSSATDITGFGLLGHAWEMAQFSNVSMVIYGDQVSVIEEAFELAKASLFPSGSVMNFEFVKPKVNFSRNISAELQMLLCDAQTSGGLLIAVPEERCGTLLNLLHTRSVTSACIIGKVIEPKERRIYVE
jgi:selenide,water dikinase